ncbi:hypothetical protein [Leifsonia virtsii]|uniref:Secreted protein n=1 Tax=Leifsonia virtsii TaxID=3035915 RepID=A0ABT8IYC7_9MICO|nr:hypothetical protein [Leifsonia virtsii]MDN4597803.1 hypothetical protein [Leifsonia virtsii]
MIHRRLAAAAVGALLVGVLAGCSADDSARSALSQSAGTAASSARAAGLVLGLNEVGQVLPTVMDTGLTDAADRLATEAKSVATMTAIGGIGASRDRILAGIRSAQDQVASAQRASAAGHDSGNALDRERRALDRLAQQLDAASKRLERG